LPIYSFIYSFFQNNLDIVFFIYGLAYVVMGLAILLQPKQKSEFRIARIFWLLALFGITHGANELLDMWTIIKGRNPLLDLVRWFVLIISYFFLFEFGRQLIVTASGSPFLKKKTSQTLIRWLSPAIGCIILFSGFLSSDFWKVGSIVTRYLLGLPGGILIGLGFFSYYRSEKMTLEPLRVKKYFLLGGASFFLYGILGGTVVPQGDFFPSNWLNAEAFLQTFKIPVQAFRALCAITAAWAISGMLNIFNWETRSKLQLYQEQLRILMSKLSITEEQERKRISEELHDNISQNLAFSKIKISALRESSPELAKDLDETRELIDQTIKFTRSLIFDLSPPVLYELGFYSAVEWFAEKIQEKHGITVEFDFQGKPNEPQGEMSVLLFKTVRELLLNIVKHAKARKAWISITSEGDRIMINVQDDGIGFDTSKTDLSSIEDRGFGILNIRERIRYLGGTFEITSQQGQGTRVAISVPFR
jgi:signal transduction histidine kinase